MKPTTDARYCVQIVRHYTDDGRQYAIDYPPQFTFAQSPHEAQERVKARLSPDYTYRLNAFPYIPTGAKEDDIDDEVRLR